MNSHHFYRFVFCSSVVLLASCSSTRGKDSQKYVMINERLDLIEDRISKLETNSETLNAKVTDLELDNSINKKSSGYQKNEIESLKEQVLTNERNIDVLRRGIKTGMYEDFNSKKPTPKAPGFPDVSLGAGPTTEIQSFQKPMDENQTVEGPDVLVEKAEHNLANMKFKESIVAVDKLRKYYPNYKDAGRSTLAIAEAWLKLKQYENTLQECALFYAQNPKSPMTAKAKVIEGQAYEHAGRGRKAAQIYAEVITLAPTTPYAEFARNALIKIRDNEF